jgi:K+-transporting ATPase KdpF subunit
MLLPVAMMLLLSSWNRRNTVTSTYLVAGLIALSLLVYLFVALLKPERFG